MSDVSRPVLNVDYIDSIPVTEDNINILNQARARLLEAQCLVAMAEGKESPVTPFLAPLCRTIDDFVNHVAKLNQLPIDVDSLPSLPARMEMRERCFESLDHARMAGIALTVHLNTALALTNASNQE